MNIALVFKEILKYPINMVHTFFNQNFYMLLLNPIKNRFL